MLSNNSLMRQSQSLPYSIYDRLSEVDQDAIVDNKRLGRTRIRACKISTG